MQTPEYARNAHKAAQAERVRDYPMAAVYWNKAARSECTEKQRHWAECRIDHCNCISGRISILMPSFCMVELDGRYSSHSFNDVYIEVKTVNNKNKVVTSQVDIDYVLSYFSDKGACEMFNKLNNYDKWINKNKERLIEAWETGFIGETQIEEDTYEDFVAAMWKIETCQDQK